MLHKPRFATDNILLTFKYHRPNELDVEATTGQSIASLPVLLQTITDQMFQALELPQATFYSRFSTTDQHTEHSGQNNIQSLPVIFIAKLPFDRSL